MANLLVGMVVVFALVAVYALRSKHRVKASLHFWGASLFIEAEKEAEKIDRPQLPPNS